MKKLLTIVMAMCLTLAVNAQTIHWLTFIDTTDENVGQLDVTGRAVLYNHFINVVNAALKEKGYKSDVQDYYDTRLSPENCKSVVENLSCESQDIVVFYYIGHGTHAREENNPYPQMLMGRGWDQESKFIPLKWVHDKLKSKGARMAVTIGMCCNVVQAARAKNAPAFAVNYGNTYLSDTERTAIQNMFLGYKGDFLLSSASPGQSSLGGTTPLGDMDLFTAVLVTYFEDMAYEGELDWANLFNSVRGSVHEITGGKQTPMFENHLAKTPIAPTQTAPTPVGQSTITSPTNNSDIIKNKLTEYFDYIVDTRNTPNARLKSGDEIENVFASGAIVRVKSKDGNVIVDKESAVDFIGRLSTSRLLLKVVPENYEKDGSGKITKLTVTEYYKK